jgi:hypothetical protein
MGTGCGGNSSEPKPLGATNTDPDRMHLSIEVTFADGTTQSATLSCLGTSHGTGYLSQPNHVGAACVTVMISGPVINYVRAKADSGFEPRSKCDAIVASTKAKAIQDLPTPPAGKAEITGTYRGYRTHRIIDGTSTDKCQLALWKLMQPLFTPSDAEVVAKYPKGSF